MRSLTSFFALITFLVCPNDSSAAEAATSRNAYKRFAGTEPDAGYD